MGRALLLILSLLLALPTEGAAQEPEPEPVPLDLPSERPYTPEIRPRPDAAERGPSPEVLLPREGPPEAVPTESRVWVDSLRIRGNRAIDDATLTAAARPLLARRLGPRQLQQLVVALTQVYLDAGYVNSGARLPAQEVRDGTLTIEIVEGRLGAVKIEGVRSFRPAVLEARLAHAIPSPLRVQEIEEALRLLEGERSIRRLDARLRPSGERGVALLEVRIEEAIPVWAQLGVDNYEPPSVGTFAARVAAGDDNLLGFGDRLWGDAALTEGLRRVAVAYRLPVHESGTLLGLEGRFSTAKVVQAPFDAIDVESEAYSIAAVLSQPLFRRPEQELWAGLTLEHRWGKTSLLGRGFSFEPGPDDGRVRLTLLRPLLEWTLRHRDFALALRSIFAIGLDLPSTTRNRGGVPDGRFFGWLGQARGIYRHPDTGIELHGRLDVQLSDDPLLPLERFAVGGPDTVRGYTRNALVRDQALVGGVELRWPVWLRGRTLVEIASFADLGWSWNRGRPTPGPRTISSVGLGLHAYPLRQLALDFEFAWPLRNLEGGNSLQAQGFLLAARWSFP